MKWALCVVGFSHGMEVEHLEIHQVIGSLTGTGSRTPNERSWLRPACTSFCQWSGTGMGVWWATGSALVSIMSLIGTPAMTGKCWCSNVLNVIQMCRSSRAMSVSAPS